MVSVFLANIIKHSGTKMITKILPWITGITCLIYIYSWTQGITYQAWVPLVWCSSCFVNDIYAYLEAKKEKTLL